MNSLSTPPSASTLVFRSLPAAASLLTLLVGLGLAAAVPIEIEGLRPLEHEDYDRWNTIRSQSISPDGNWVMYTVQSGEVDSDATLTIHNIESGKQYVIARGAGARFSYDSRFAVYRIEPDKKLLKKLEQEEADADEKPVAQLQILTLESGAQVTVDRVKSFGLPEENGRWLAYHLLEPIDSDAVKQQESDVGEVYEVTAAGLIRPAKEVALKKRPPPPETLPAEERAAGPEMEKSNQEKEAEPEATTTEPVAKQKKSDDEDDDADDKPEGTTLVLRDLDSGIERRFPKVVEYMFSKYGHTLAFASSLKHADDESDESDADDDHKTTDEQTHDEGDDTQPTDGVYVFELNALELKQVLSGPGNYKQLVLDDAGSQLAFVTDRNDFEAETPTWDLYLWKKRQTEARQIATETTDEVPADWWISPTAKLTFSEDNRRLYFSTAPIPEAVLEERTEAKTKADDSCETEDESDEDNDDEEPKAKLDIWHWQDPLLQPQQLLQVEEERKRSYRAVYNLKRNSIAQLATKSVPVVAIDRRSTADVAVANSDFRYRKQLSWLVPGYEDTYLVNLTTGEREMVREKVRSSARMSPVGKFITWWDAVEKKWFGMSTGDNREAVEISAGIPHPLQNELHDIPTLPSPYGIAGWLQDDRAVWIYDRFDIWQLDPTGDEPPKCVTAGLGRETTIRFRYLRLDPDLRSIDPEIPIVLSAFDETTKASGYYQLRLQQAAQDAEPETGNDAPPASPLKQLIMLDESISDLTKAKNSDRVIFRRSSFRKCPDIWASTLEFKTIQRISHTNPQQHEYTWGTAELITWRSADDQPLAGLLYKPDGFDPKKKYPLLVYFYERNADNLHRYHTPAPSRAIVNFSFYVSRGNVLFVPDIPYKTGEPGQSAVDSIVPGVKHLIDLGFVDEQRIGVQGHSWGGYQTSYLVTQTDMFACAEAGAPVSNMTSAYGGIRWGSGMSRMFQYERTQSRIGEDLWAARDKYIANSPLFFVDQINTPLLILHNDDDGAVPWYQGIELFVAMRRLGKPCWLLNYNEEPHGVVKDENRRDFTIRMQQFFDHYLRDAPEPEWMAVGVPAVDKGKNFGLELLEPKSE